MHSYPVRLVLVLWCTFIYHHTLCFLKLVALLSMCRFACSFKHFLGVNVQEPSTNWAFCIGTGKLVLFWNCRPWAMSHSVRYKCLSHVYPVLAQTSLRICAVLQEHLLLGHSNLSHMHIHVTIFNMRTQLSSTLQFHILVYTCCVCTHWRWLWECVDGQTDLSLHWLHR